MTNDPGVRTDVPTSFHLRDPAEDLRASVEQVSNYLHKLDSVSVTDTGNPLWHMKYDDASIGEFLRQQDYSVMLAALDKATDRFKAFSQSQSTSKGLCFAFSSDGGCPNGSNCKFDHSAGPQIHDLKQRIQRVEARSRAPAHGLHAMSGQVGEGQGDPRAPQLDTGQLDTGQFDTGQFFSHDAYGMYDVPEADSEQLVALYQQLDLEEQQLALKHLQHSADLKAGNLMRVNGHYLDSGRQLW